MSPDMLARLPFALVSAAPTSPASFTVPGLHGAAIIGGACRRGAIAAAVTGKDRQQVAVRRQGDLETRLAGEIGKGRIHSGVPDIRRATLSGAEPLFDRCRRQPAGRLVAPGREHRARWIELHALAGAKCPGRDQRRLVRTQSLAPGGRGAGHAAGDARRLDAIDLVSNLAEIADSARYVGVAIHRWVIVRGLGLKHPLRR